MAEVGFFKALRLAVTMEQNRVPGPVLVVTNDTSYAAIVQSIGEPDQAHERLHPKGFIYFCIHRATVRAVVIRSRDSIDRMREIAATSIRMKMGACPFSSKINMDILMCSFN